MSRMFSGVKTWNPVVGCGGHQCSYCWARRLAETRLKWLLQYINGFKPYLVEKELKRRFTGGTIFVSSMGDLFGHDVPASWIVKVIDNIRLSPKATFLFLTKNPRRYRQFVEIMPENVLCGTTIESNVTYKLSKAPNPMERVREMMVLQKRKFLSIEPIMDFDLDHFIDCIKLISPEFVYIGYDNYHQRNLLPEPPLEKTLKLIARLREFTEVRLKTLREAWNTIP